MAMRHFYLGIENLNLNNNQRQVLVDELKALGQASDSQPARLNHWRTRLDGEAIILEANFNEDNLTIQRFKQRLAATFGISADDISHVTQNRSFSGDMTLLVTFAYGGTDYLRFALFGGGGASWMQSGDECRGYLAANKEEWE
ncbi:MAG TPA: hypothetical protein ENH62_02225 [Marinobacter sp.]|uniref:Uncharacterized protein n=1 Tax=marine sediment metagenome TaxID=412755 RepID=A0A0F9QGJ3_9ZZZZ|nr:hypothetical protein [Marinobacter sp.]HEC61434.1 hypothetical protein [bacterium]